MYKLLLSKYYNYFEGFISFPNQENKIVIRSANYGKKSYTEFEGRNP